MALVAFSMAISLSSGVMFSSLRFSFDVDVDVDVDVDLLVDADVEGVFV
jgi:hypothetical protein